jgi:hypothetical protein
MTRSLDRLTEALLIAAKRAGADAADAIAVDGIATSIDIRAGKLEQAERSEGVELGLRVRLASLFLTHLMRRLPLLQNAPLRWRAKPPTTPMQALPIHRS